MKDLLAIQAMLKHLIDMNTESPSDNFEEHDGTYELLHKIKDVVPSVYVDCGLSIRMRNGQQYELSLMKK